MSARGLQGGLCPQIHVGAIPETLGWQARAVTEGRAVPDIYLIAIPGIKPLPCRDTSPLRPVAQVTAPQDVVDLFAVKPVELG